MNKNYVKHIKFKNMKNFNQIARAAFVNVVESVNSLNFLSGYIMPLEETSKNHWPANKVIFALIATYKDKVLVYRMGCREIEVINADNCYFPQKVGDTIKVDLKYMMLVGTKDGIPQYREVSYCRAIAG